MLHRILVLLYITTVATARSINQEHNEDDPKETSFDFNYDYIEHFLTMMFGRPPIDQERGVDKASAQEDETGGGEDDETGGSKANSEDEVKLFDDKGFSDEDIKEFSSRSDEFIDAIEKTVRLSTERKDAAISRKEGPGYHEVWREEFLAVLDSGDQDRLKKMLWSLGEDPLSIKAKDLKHSQLLAADLYFHFLVRNVIYFVSISLLLPLVIPVFDIAATVLQTLLT